MEEEIQFLSHSGTADGTDDDSQCTVSQFAAIKSLAKNLNLKAQETSRRMFGISIEDLSVNQANDVIKHLKNLEESHSNCLVKCRQ